MSYRKYYDKIYFICTNQENPEDELKTIEGLFESHDDFVKDITTYEMDNKFKPNSTTTFISIQWKTENQ